MYFNFDTDAFSATFVVEDEIYGYRRLSPEERERRLNWHLPGVKPKPPPQPKEWRGEPWDECQDEEFDFAQDDPGTGFDEGPEDFDLPMDYGWPDKWGDYAT